MKEWLAEPALPRPCLALVTNRRLCKPIPLEDVVSNAVAGGVNLVQLREKDLPGKPYLELAQKLWNIIRGRALFFVNERVDVAIACGADGVQLGEAALPPWTVRQMGGESMLIGSSVHSVAGARQAEENGADFLLVGTIFSTDSKPQATPAGPILVQQIAQTVHIPVLGIGGIQTNNLDQVMDAGAHGVAVMGAVMGHPKSQHAAQALRHVLDMAWQRHQG